MHRGGGRYRNATDEEPVERNLLRCSAIFAEVTHVDEFRWANTATTQRLLAFAMGLAIGWTDNMDREEFEILYPKLCGALQKDVAQCRDFAQQDSIPDRQSVTEEQHFLDSMCDHRTFTYRTRVAREPN